LFRVSLGERSLDASDLRSHVAIGAERTMDQDPRFVFRIMVDIAAKALSPGINDPTTAVLALDQIHRLLLNVGRRHLGDGQARDPQNHLRLCFGTPNWSDFVSLALVEIRQYGASHMQVARRLHVLLDHLLRVLPDERKDAVREVMNSVAEQMSAAERTEILREIVTILARDVPAIDRQGIVEHIAAENNANR